MADSIKIMGLVGTGVMGAGIAQIAAQAGVLVRLFDARDGAAQTARDNLGATLSKLAAKGKDHPGSGGRCACEPASRRHH